MRKKNNSCNRGLTTYYVIAKITSVALLLFLCLELALSECKQWRSLLWHDSSPEQVF